MKVFKQILEIIEKVVKKSKNFRKVIILTPFMCQKYVKLLIEFIDNLNRKVGKIVIIVVTR